MQILYSQVGPDAGVCTRPAFRPGIDQQAKQDASSRRERMSGDTDPSSRHDGGVMRVVSIHLTGMAEVVVLLHGGWPHLK